MVQVSNTRVQLPHWFLFVRIAQAVFCLVTLGLCAFGASVWAVFSGYGLNFWTSIYTAAFLAFWFFFRPRVTAGWNITWFHLAAELFVAFWWLVTFALLASEASLLTSAEDIVNAYTGKYDGYTGYGALGDAALGCTKAAAVFGAFMFVSFLVTIGFFFPAMQRAHRLQVQGNNPRFDAMKAEQGYGYSNGNGNNFSANNPPQNPNHIYNNNQQQSGPGVMV